MSIDAKLWPNTVQGVYQGMKTTEEILIRCAEHADLDDLVHLENSSFDYDRMTRRSLRHAISSPTGVVVVAENTKGNLVAYAVVFLDRRNFLARLYSIAVSEEVRGSGIGRKLLLDVEQRVTKRGFHRIRLEGQVGPTGPLGFYRRLGYQHVESLPEYYEHGADAERMEKRLYPNVGAQTLPLLLVDNDGFDLPKDLPARIMTLRDYLGQSDIVPGRIVVNLARSYEMLSKGYYASLLAEARGEISLPHASDLLDINWKRIHRQALTEFTPLVRRAFAGGEKEGSFEIHFGMTSDPRLQIVGALMFERFRCPVLRIYHNAIGDIEEIEAVRADKSDQDLFIPNLRKFLSHGTAPPIELKKHAISIAMLVDPDEHMPPSDAMALIFFEDAALEIGARITRITKRDLHKLSQFDALFIRETTSLDHHTYRFARKAELEGLCVIDSPDAILKCSNKIYLHERLLRAGVPVPRTLVFDNKELPYIAASESFPMVLKIPDGSFSKGVHLVETPEGLIEKATSLFGHSDLLLLQEFMPTDYDWRIGVLDGQTLFACKYFMAPKHWQIYNHSISNSESGPSEAIPIHKVPHDILQIAIQASNCIGKGLFGVDIKIGPKGPVVIEVNDNPNIDQGVEDVLEGKELYRKILLGLIAPLLEDEREHRS
ncbi:MAG: GNAT family N-acetyltransferase [archaeon]|jgi:glutathione synthase/RimK-type ligase-like ATP-grasp enzyme/ribosomal protein S18 acetylase RimI-like enzyme|nr:GNAT family N-acetyltransferase [archaeon]MDA1167556.1 GNAT family N-acetyltransferase [archaeon]